MRYERELKVSKTGAYQLGVSQFTEGEPVTSFSVTSDTRITIDSQEEENSVIKFTATGVSVGRSEVHFEFATATTSDCTTAYIYVVEDC